jgi:hypothetical protein
VVRRLWLQTASLSSRKFFEKIIIKKRDAKKSKSEATSGRNTKVHSETQTEAKSRQRDCANADGQEIVRRL